MLAIRLTPASSSKHRSHSTQTTACPFLEIPRELRDLIYTYVFSGSQLTLDQDTSPSSSRSTSPIPSKRTIQTRIYHNAAFQKSLLQTNSQIHLEAPPILAHETSLLILPGIPNPNLTISSIPAIYLLNIRTILNTTRVRSRITHVLRQDHLDPTPFPNLKLYRVAHLIYPDWRDSCHKPDDVDPFVESHLETDFFFQAGTLKLFTRERTYQLTVTVWLLRAFAERSCGWEVEFSLDTWTVIRKRRACFLRHKDLVEPLIDDPKARDYRNYDVQLL